MFLSFALKIAFGNFFLTETVFEHPWPRNLIICTNTELVFLEALKKWFLQLSSKMTFSAKSLNKCNICRQEFNWLYASPEGGGS